MASVEFNAIGDFSPTTPFDFTVGTNSPEVTSLTTAAGNLPTGTTKPSIAITADFQNLNPIDITFTPAAGSPDATFYIDPTITNDTGHIWSGFSLQIVEVDPGHFEEFSGDTEHPDYPHFHDATSGIFVDPQIGSLSIEGSEVYGYVGENLDGIDEESKATLSSNSLNNEIYNGDTETWQDFGVHDPVADGTFTLQLTPIIDATGFAAGNETLLNTSVAGNQVPADHDGSGASPSQLAALSNGEAIAVWDNENSGQVEARIVSAAGPVGQQITVGSGNDGTVAALANGNFIVVWWDPAANTGLGAVQSQMYASSGSPVGGTDSLFVGTSSSGTNYGESNLSVTGLTDGGYELSFTFQGAGAAPFSQVYTYTYDQSGTQVGHITNGSSSSTFFNGLPQTAQLSDGNLVSTWQDGQGHIYTQIFTEDGTSIKQLSLGSPYDNTTGGQGTPPDSVSNPTVAALANGDFVVAWEDETEGQIQFDIWNADGSEAIALNQPGSAFGENATAPAIAALADGQFAITWADASGSSIKAALFNPDGTPDGDGVPEDDEFVVNKDQSGNQVAPNIVGLSGGGMYVDWGDESGRLGDTSGFGVAGQAFGELYSPGLTGEYNVADFLANQTSIDQNGDIRVSDTAANIAANLDALNADRNVDEIILTDGGTPALTLTPEQATNDWQAIGKIEGSYSLAVPTADILWQNTSGQVAIWEMVGTTPVNQQAISPNPGPNWKTIGTGDFNADGHADILWQNTSGQVAIWEMNGTNPINQQAISFNPGSSWDAIGTGDFNGDGRSDILWQNTSGQVAIWEMNGLTPIDQQTAGANPGANWKAVGTGDFNGDGKSDILWQNTNGQVAIWEMNGTTPIDQEALSLNPGPNWKAVGTGDFNDDGKSDILWQNTNGQVAIWEMNGTTPMAQVALSLNPGPAWQVVGTSDFNGDGHSDILFQNTTSGQAAIWEMNGLTPISQSLVSSLPGAGWQAIKA
jgi:hypothetical protein